MLFEDVFEIWVFGTVSRLADTGGYVSLGRRDGRITLDIDTDRHVATAVCHSKAGQADLRVVDVHSGADVLNVQAAEGAEFQAAAASFERLLHSAALQGA